MKVLQLCNKVPFPPKDGGCMAMNNLTQGLIQQGVQVKVLAINTKKHFTDIEKLPKSYRDATNIEAVFIDTDVKVMDALLNLFTSKSYNISRFYSKDFEHKLIELLQADTYDIVQLESLYVSMYADVIRNYSGAKIVLRTHNIEHQLWELSSEQSNNFLKKRYLQLLAKRLKYYELKSLSKYDAIAAITKTDEQFFKSVGFSKPICTIPFGIDIGTIKQYNEIQQDTYSIFHIGAMDWQPNIEGLQWFLNNVWDKVHSQHPQLKFYIAGRNMQTEYWQQFQKPNVVVVGEVEDAQKFMQSKGIMVVPLLSGAGMRVKIIEGMAMGKTIITTPKGMEGITCTTNKECIIAANEDEFVNAIQQCINNTIFCKSVGENAKQLATTQYNNTAICKRLIDFYSGNV